MLVLVNIRMINLSLDELRLIAQIRNITNNKNKSKEDLIKVLSESDPKPETKPKTKPETKPKPKPEPKLELEQEIKVNKKKLKKLRKDFDELRHKFSNKDEMREYREAFYDAKKDKLSESKMKKLNETLNKLKKVFNLKNFIAIFIVLIMKTLIIMIIIMILLMMTNTEKLEVLEHYLKSLRVIITNQ